MSLMVVFPMCVILVVVWCFVFDGCLFFVCNIVSSIEFCL